MYRSAMSKIIILTTLHHNFRNKYQDLAKCLAEYFEVIIATDEYPSYILNKNSFRINGINFFHTTSEIFCKNIPGFKDVLIEIFKKNETYIMQCDADRYKYYGACSLALANQRIWLENNINFITYLLTSDIKFFISEGPNGALERYIYLCHKILDPKFELIAYKRGKVGDTWIAGFGSNGYDALQVISSNNLDDDGGGSIVPLYATPSSPLRRGLFQRILNVPNGDTFSSLKYILASIISFRSDSVSQARTHLNMVTFGILRDCYRWLCKIQLKFNHAKASSQYWVFPEQYHPEAATSAIQIELADELLVIDKLKPFGLEVSYKPHPSCLGRNGFMWYSKIPLRILDWSINPAKDSLCIGCITVNSTMILDFLIEGKPVICLGDNELIRLFEEFICRIAIIGKINSKETQSKINRYLSERAICNRKTVFERLSSISLTNKTISRELKERA